jgi:hypothetical protein
MQILPPPIMMLPQVALDSGKLAANRFDVTM